MWKCFCILLLVPFTSSANIISYKPEQTSVTIYRASNQGNPNLANPLTAAQGIALISETRQVELPVGNSIVDFVGVAQTIVPESARLESTSGTILETNFDYKLISGEELIANSLGQMVQVVRTDADSGKITTQRAKLLAGSKGVILDIGGNLEALDCSGAHEKIIFETLPENLRSKPVLSTQIRVKKAGKYSIHLSYLAFGFDWATNYVAQIQSDGHSLNLTGWITLANKQDTAFLNSPVQVIAGNIERDKSTKPAQIRNAQTSIQCWPIGKLYTNRVIVDSIFAEDMGKFPDSNLAVALNRIAPVTLAAPAAKPIMGSAQAEQRDLGDYKLYALPYRTDLMAKQVKQVLMNFHQNVPFEKIYTFVVAANSVNTDAQNSAYPANFLLRMHNKKDSGLGSPLPAGKVVLMEPSGNQLLLAGADFLKDTPVGLPIDLEMGSSSNLMVMPKIIRSYQTNNGKNTYDYEDVEVVLKNYFLSAVKFELRQPIAGEGVSISKESSEHIMRKGMPTWVLNIPGRTEIKINYTLRATRY